MIHASSPKALPVPDQSEVASKSSSTKPATSSDRKAPAGSYLPHSQPVQGSGRLMQVALSSERLDSANKQYSKWSSDYDKDTASYGWCAPQMLLEWATQLAPPASPQRVLDVGVGTGQAARPYVDAGAQVVGLDLSQAMLDEAKIAVPRFHHLATYDINQPLSTAGQKPESFDLVLSSGTLHFAEDMQSTLRHLGAALRPGGHLVFTYVPTQDRGFMKKTTPHAPEAIEAWLTEQGLEIEGHDRFIAYYDKGDENDSVEYCRVAARRPGKPLKTSGALAHLDRTSSVDRDQILKLSKTPVALGPIGSIVSTERAASDNDKMLSAVRQQMEDGELNAGEIPWPLTVAEGVDSEPLIEALGIFAHPDDESVYTGGTMAAIAEGGHSLALAYTTGGGGGRGGEGTDLEIARRAEQQAALDVLGLSDVERLEVGLADFGKYTDDQRSVPATAFDSLKTWGLDETVEALVRAIRSQKPKTLLTFEPSRDPNYSLHGHHLGTGFASYIAYHLAADPRAFPEHLEEGLQPFAVTHHQVVVPDATPGARVTDVAVNRETKIAALEAHASQGFSTERSIEALNQNEPRTRHELWHLAQSRDGSARASTGVANLLNPSKGDRS